MPRGSNITKCLSVSATEIRGKDVAVVDDEAETDRSPCSVFSAVQFCLFHDRSITAPSPIYVYSLCASWNVLVGEARDSDRRRRSSPIYVLVCV